MTDPDDDFANALGRLPLPRPSALTVGYAAGFAAGRRRERAWQLTTVAAAVVAAVAVGRRPEPSPVFVDRVVYVRPPAPAAEPPPSSEAASVLRLRQADLTALPTAGGRGKQQVTLGLLWPHDLPSRTDLLP